MKSLLLTFAVLSCGTNSFAQDNSNGTQNLYDKTIKVEYMASKQALNLNLDRESYSWTIFDNERFLKKVSTNQEAEKIFRESLNSRTIGFISGISFMVLSYGAAAVEIYGNTLAKDGGVNSQYSFIGAGMIIGSGIALLVGIPFDSSAEEKFYEGINKYNSTILSAKD